MVSDCCNNINMLSSSNTLRCSGGNEACNICIFPKCSRESLLMCLIAGCSCTKEHEECLIITLSSFLKRIEAKARNHASIYQPVIRWFEEKIKLFTIEIEEMRDAMSRVQLFVSKDEAQLYSLISRGDSELMTIELVSKVAKSLFQEPTIDVSQKNAAISFDLQKSSAKVKYLINKLRIKEVLPRDKEDELLPARVEAEEKAEQNSEERVEEAEEQIAEERIEEIVPPEVSQSLLQASQVLNLQLKQVNVTSQIIPREKQSIKKFYFSESFHSSKIGLPKCCLSSFSNYLCFSFLQPSLEYRGLTFQSHRFKVRTINTSTGDHCKIYVGVSRRNNMARHNYENLGPDYGCLGDIVFLVNVQKAQLISSGLKSTATPLIFVLGDTIQIDYNPLSKTISLINPKTKVTETKGFTFQKDNELYLCVGFQGTSAEVEYLGEFSV